MSMSISSMSRWLDGLMLRAKCSTSHWNMLLMLIPAPLSVRLKSYKFIEHLRLWQFGTRPSSSITRGSLFIRWGCSSICHLFWISYDLEKFFSFLLVYYCFACSKISFQILLQMCWFSSVRFLPAVAVACWCWWCLLYSICVENFNYWIFVYSPPSFPPRHSLTSNQNKSKCKTTWDLLGLPYGFRMTYLIILFLSNFQKWYRTSFLPPKKTSSCS